MPPAIPPIDQPPSVPASSAGSMRGTVASRVTEQISAIRGRLEADRQQLAAAADDPGLAETIKQAIQNYNAVLGQIASRLLSSDNAA